VVVGSVSGRATSPAICVGPCPIGRAVAGLSIRHSGNLATAGVAFLGAGALVVVLLGGGGLMLLAGRRRARVSL
jgi:hypothetical protein